MCVIKNHIPQYVTLFWGGFVCLLFFSLFLLKHLLAVLPFVTQRQSRSKKGLLHVSGIRTISRLRCGRS
jgi:hypothetical protein